MTVARVERTHRGAFIEQLLETGFALVAGVLVGLVEPERGTWKVGDDVGNADLAHARLATLDRRDDRNDADAWIHQCLQRFAQPWRMIRAKSARDR